jgi:thiosulfate reductase cytochrome b subunit
MVDDEASHIGHSSVVRITHWVTTLAFVALVVSGYVITMTHPRLYWGDVGNELTPAWLTLPIPQKFGESGWGRSLHFLGAWILVLTGIVYVAWSVMARHFARDLVPRREELSSSHLRQEIRKQRRWHVLRGVEYGLTQKISYLIVILLLAPLAILTGLTLSPAVTAAYPWLFSLFGGFQSARTIHFLDSLVLVLFVLVHVIMVVRSGFAHQMRSMTLGDPSYGRHPHLTTDTVSDGR